MKSQLTNESWLLWLLQCCQSKWLNRESDSSMIQSMIGYAVGSVRPLSWLIVALLDLLLWNHRRWVRSQLAKAPRSVEPHLAARSLRSGAYGFGTHQWWNHARKTKIESHLSWGDMWHMHSRGSDLICSSRAQIENDGPVNINGNAVVQPHWKDLIAIQTTVDWTGSDDYCSTTRHKGMNIQWTLTEMKDRECEWYMRWLCRCLAHEVIDWHHRRSRRWCDRPTTHRTRERSTDVDWVAWKIVSKSSIFCWWEMVLVVKTQLHRSTRILLAQLAQHSETHHRRNDTWLQ